MTTFEVDAVCEDGRITIVAPGLPPGRQPVRVRITPVAAIIQQGRGPITAEELAARRRAVERIIAIPDDVAPRGFANDIDRDIYGGP